MPTILLKLSLFPNSFITCGNTLNNSKNRSGFTQSSSHIDYNNTFIRGQELGGMGCGCLFKVIQGLRLRDLTLTCMSMTNCRKRKNEEGLPACYSPQPRVIHAISTYLSLVRATHTVQPKIKWLWKLVLRQERHFRISSTLRRRMTSCCRASDLCYTFSFSDIRLPPNSGSHTVTGGKLVWK